jgi:proteasome lid subunit RPN8/RPN11
MSRRSRAAAGPGGGGGSAWQVLLPRRLRRRLERLAREGYPREACAVLVGRRQERSARVVYLHGAENLHADGHRRYLLDPGAFVGADLVARQAGLEVLGFWHTHPDHAASPSETDLAEAWEGYSYLIQAVNAAGAGELRSWRLDGDAFVEEEVHPAGASEPREPTPSSRHAFAPSPLSKEP